jgi:hypothetical protein
MGENNNSRDGENRLNIKRTSGLPPGDKLTSLRREGETRALRRDTEVAMLDQRASRKRWWI